jgi:chromate transporter
MRRRFVEEKRWIDAREFEDAIAATNLLPGPASTQLAIFCAWKLRRAAGAVVGAVGFIVPGLILILILSAVFLSSKPPHWILGAAAGAGAAVPAVALNAAWGLAPASWERMGPGVWRRLRWSVYAVSGAVAAVLVGPYLVLVLLACGVGEITIRRASRPARPPTDRAFFPAALAPGAAVGGLGALAWVAFKVGALSYGGGFVIIPLMQHDAVHTYHWMTSAQFLYAVALGQMTPGPVVLTVAAVGYAAAGVAGGLLATGVAFLPSLCFVLAGGPRFQEISSNPDIQAFLTGAGPAAIGAIGGSAVTLALGLQHLWQIPVVVAAGLWMFVLRRGVVSAVLLSGATGVVLGLAGVPV